MDDDSGLSHGSNRVRDDVFFADRAAACQNHHLALAVRQLGPLDQQRQVVLHNPVGFGDASTLIDQPRQRVGVHVMDLAAAQRSAGRDQFITCNDDRDAGSPVHGHLRNVQPREQAQILRSEAAPGPDDHLPRSDVCATGEDVLIHLDGSFHGHRPIRSHGMLLHDDRVGALREHSPSRDPRRLPRADGKPHRLPHQHLSDHLQMQRGPRGGPAGIPRTDRIAVHRGPIKCRQIGRGPHFLRQHAPQRLRQGDAFRPKW